MGGIDISLFLFIVEIMLYNLLDRLKYQGFTTISKNPLVFEKPSKIISIPGELFSALINILSYPFFSFTEIKKSGIKNGGNGIFSKIDLSPNSFITLYPCELMIWNFETGESIPRRRDMFHKIHKLMKEVKEGKTNFEKYMVLSIGDFQYLDILGNRIISPQPSIKILAFGDIYYQIAMGHITNDCVPLWIIEEIKKIRDNNDDIMLFIDLYRAYINDAYKYANAVIIDFNNVFFLKSIVNIKKGDEIFVSYGFSYWASHLAKDWYRGAEEAAIHYLVLQDPTFLDRFNHITGKKYTMEAIFM